MTQQQGGRVARRRVFYIPGYDPFPPRRYRELYRSEGAVQAVVSGYRIALKPAAGPRPQGWLVEAEIGGAAVVTEFEVLVWSDLVKGSMATGIGATYLQLLRTVWIYVASGALLRLMRLRKGPVIAAFYPVVMLLVQLGLACLAGWGISALVGGWLVGGWLAGWQLAGWAGGLAGLAAVGLILRWFRALDGALYAYYLMHDYAYAAAHGGAYPPGLEARIARFADRIAAALDAEADEVLVVGHSSGAQIGVSVLADLIRSGRVLAGGPALGFLSLGQVVPMVSFLPEAHRLRADLHDLAARNELTWVDVTAPGDGCAFALCDPVSVSGMAPAGKRWPLVISAAFSRTLSPQRWKALRWRFFRLHFQYLCAFDRPGDYDYFQITAGPLTLAARYAERLPSKSRIETAVSGHRSKTA